jgi:hypothetical protein
MPRLRFLLLIVLLLIGHALRLHGLADKAVWFDEGWNSWMSRFGWIEIMVRVSTDTAPPLHFWLLRVVRGLAGESAFALRYLSLSAGVLTVAVTAQIGRIIPHSPRQRLLTSLIAALLLTFSRFHISWSQEIRMYTLSALFAALTLWGALRIWQRGRRSDWLLYGAGAVLGLYTHYLAVFVLAAVNLAWLWHTLWTEENRATRLRWLTGQIVIVLLFAPWLLYALGRMRSWSAESPVTLATYLEIMWVTLTIGIPVAVAQFRPWTVPLALLLLAGSGVLLWQGGRDRHTGRNLVLLATGLLLPALLIFILALPGREFLYTPPVAPRYFTLFVAPHAVWLGWALAALIGRNRPLGSAATLFALAVALVGLAPYYPGRVEQDIFQSAAEVIHTWQQPEDGIILLADSDWPTFDFYVGPGWHGVPSSWQLDASQTEAFLAPLWQAHPTLWLVTTPEGLRTDPHGLMVAWLAEKGEITLDWTLGDKRVLRVARSAELPAPHTDRWQSGKPRYWHAVSRYESGDVIQLFLAGELPQAVHLVDGAGDVWQSADTDLAGTTARAALTVPPEAPSGRYHFRIGETAAPFGQLELRQKVRAWRTSADVRISTPLDVRFADNVRLIGYDLERLDPQAQVVPLTLYWQADGPVSRRYKIFTHLFGEQFNAAQGNFLWGQQDNEPAENSHPTTLWRTGEVIVDRYRIPFADGAPPGSYQLHIGLYDPVTGARLEVVSGNDGGGGGISADYLLLTPLTLESR